METGKASETRHIERKKCPKRAMRLQNSMEFMITYGWALLLIATITALMFEFGFFNVIAPRARPGQCRVARLGGIYTAQNINLFGLCLNELPQTVTNFGLSYDNGGVCKGKSNTCTFPSYVSVNPFPPGVLTNSFTITAWIYWEGAYALGNKNDSCQGIFVSNPSKNGFGLYGNGTNQGECSLIWIGGSLPPNTKWFSSSWVSFPKQSWQFIAAEYNGTSGEATIYNNSDLFGSATVVNRSFATNDSFTIGAAVESDGSIHPFNGYISNVQLYNTSLGSDYITALYKEGIGGAPVDLRNLVGWWPLNSNANDYSGDFNNGTVYNISYPGGYPTTIP